MLTNITLPEQDNRTINRWTLCYSYSQVPNKRGVLIDRELEKIPKFNKRGVKINGEST